jgi:hypothetical protein
MGIRKLTRVRAEWQDSRYQGKQQDGADQNEREKMDLHVSLHPQCVCVCFDGPFLQPLTIDDGLSLSVRVYIGVRGGYGSCVSTTLHTGRSCGGLVGGSQCIDPPRLCRKNRLLTLFGLL